MEVGDFFFAMLALNEAVNKLHRTRAIEGDHSDDVVKGASLEVAEVAFHAGRL